MRTASTTLTTALAPAMWGTTYLTVAELLPAGEPLTIAALRALPVGLVGLLLVHTLPRGAWWARIAALGTLNIGLFFGLLFVAADRLPGGLAGTLTALSPVVVAFLGWPLLAQRPSVLGLGGALVGVVGVGLMVLAPGARFDLIGVLAALGAAGSVGLGITLTRRWGRPAGVGLGAFTTWQLTAGGLVLLPVAVALEGAPSGFDGSAWLAMAYLAVLGTALGNALWFNGIERLGASRTALLSLLSPLVAVTLGALVQGEAFGPRELACSLLLLAGLLIGQRAARRPACRTAPVPRPLAVA